MQTENAALGEVVSTERVTNLPLNGRRFIDLAALTPGVTVRTESQFSLVRANGTRDTTMSLTFDGVKATANRWAFVAIFPLLTQSRNSEYRPVTTLRNTEVMPAPT